MTEVILVLWGIISAIMIFMLRGDVKRLTKEFADFKVEAGAAYRRLRDGADEPAQPVKPQTPIKAETSAPLPPKTSPLLPQPQKITSIAAPIEIPVVKTAAAPASVPPKIVSPTFKPRPAPALEMPKLSLDKFLSGNWLVWIGGIAMALGGAFLVKIANDNGFFGPAVRVIMGAIIAVIMMGASEYLRRRPLAKAFGGIGPDMAPAMFAGAGLFIGYADIVAAHTLYNYIGQIETFIILALISVGAIGLSPRHGKPLGILGLLGANIVPVLVRSDIPRPASLYVFLTLIALTTVGTFRVQRWWKMSGLALAANLAWAAIGVTLIFDKTNGALKTSIALSLFLIATALIFGSRWQPARKFILEEATELVKPNSAFKARARDMVDRISGLAGISTAFLMLVVCTRSDFNPIIMWLGVALCGLLMLRAVTREGLDILASVSVASLLIAHLIWAKQNEYGLNIDYTSWLMLLVGTVGGSALIMLFMAPRRQAFALWSLGATIALISGYILSRAYYGGHLLTYEWALVAVAVSIPLFVSLAHLRQSGNLILSQHIYVLGFFAFWLEATQLLFSGNNLTLALALTVTLMAAVHQHIRLKSLQWLAGGVALFVLARLAFNPDLANQVIQPPILNWLLPIYGGAAIAMLIAHRLFRKNNGTPMLLNLLEAASLGLTVMLVSLNIRSFIADDNKLTGSYGFVEQAMHSISWLGFSLGLGAVRRQNVSIVIIAARWILFGAALINIVLFQILFSSPLFTNISVGDLLLANSLALGILLPGILLIIMMLFAERRQDTVYGKIAGGIGMLLIIFWSALEWRHVFQGGKIGLGNPLYALEACGYPLLFFAWSFVLGYVKQATSRFELKYIGYGAFILACTWVVLGNILSLSPLVKTWSVGSLPLFNLLALAYLAPAALIFARLKYSPDMVPDWLRKSAYSAIGALLFIWCNLSLKHLFQGSILSMDRGVSDSEYYAYSLLWLVMSAGLFFAAIRTHNKGLEYAFIGLTFITIGKVFLFDMSQLQGILRAISFMGLGLALVVLGLLYRRFLYRQVTV
jgi:uncharacterized membrane protein